MNHCSRLLLELTSEAIFTSGLQADALSTELTGVFVGISGQDFASLNARQERQSVYSGKKIARSLGDINIIMQVPLRSNNINFCCFQETFTFCL